MIDPNAPACPHPEYVVEERDKARVYTPQPGMTIRATMAMHIMSGLLANAGGPIQANGMSGWGLVNCDLSDVAKVAVAATDFVITELNKTEQS